jgi:hypothetical protein
MQYRERKAKLRKEAITWQHDFEKHNFSMSEIAEKQAYFEKKAWQLGLVKEFKENGII